MHDFGLNNKVLIQLFQKLVGCGAKPHVLKNKPPKKGGKSIVKF